MKIIQQYFFIFLTVSLVLMTAPIRAETNYYNADDTERDESAVPEEEPVEGARNFRVTSVEKCYALLDREDALDIQRSYVKPYQECQRRLALKLKKKQEKEAGEAKEDTPKTTHGFYRVQKDKADKSPAEPDSKEKKPADK